METIVLNVLDGVRARLTLQVLDLFPFSFVALVSLLESGWLILLLMVRLLLLIFGLIVLLLLAALITNLFWLSSGTAFILSPVVSIATWNVLNQLGLVTFRNGRDLLLGQLRLHLHFLYINRMQSESVQISYLRWSRSSF